MHIYDVDWWNVLQTANKTRGKINRYLTGRLFAISTAALLRNDEASL